LTLPAHHQQQLQPFQAVAASPSSDQLFYDLQLHQLELELQNAELQRVRAELEQERTRYFNLYELAPVGYCTVSSAGLILQANLSAAKLLSVPRAELLMQPFSAYLRGDGGDAFHLLGKRLVASGQAESIDLPMFRRDGTQLLVHLVASMVQDADGKKLMLMALTDITARQQLEALRSKKEAAESAYQAKSHFLAAASHDLRQPTHAMGLFLARLAALPHPPETLQLVNYLAQSVSNLQLLLDALFEASQLETDPPQVSAMESLVPAPSQVAQALTEGAALDAAVAGLRLLVIEDNALGRTALTSVLDSWGCEVTAAEGPHSACEQLQLGLNPDVIVSDYRLHDGCNGIDTIHRLRALAGREIAACLISADSDARLRQQAQDAGLVLLQKPVRPAKLRNLLRHFQQDLAR
jgi:PAS domain S-box-containing protein